VDVPELHPSPPPHEVAYLWDWVSELANGWQAGMSMPQFYSELGWWALLTGRALAAWEVKTMYRLYLKSLSVEAEGQK
jgi:hypothetical protein